MAFFSAFGCRQFALLWLGQTASRLGDSIYQLALVWWLVEQTGSAATSGSVLLAALVPTSLLALFGGAAVDRWPRIGVMLIADVARGGLTIVLAALAFTNTLAIWHVLLTSVLSGLVNAFFQPAYTAALPELTPKQLLPSANALSVLSAELTGVAGPVLAALLIGVGGISLAFLINALSFCVSALSLLPLLQARLKSLRPNGYPHDGPALLRVLWTQCMQSLTSIGQGFHVVATQPWLWITTLILALLNLTGRSPMNVSLPFLVRDNLDADVNVLGILYASFSLGSMAGALWVGSSGRFSRRGVGMYSCLVATGGLTFALGLLQSLPAAIVAIFAIGTALAVTNLTWSHLLQEHVPSTALGRVASINLLCSTSLLPVGFSLAGWATDELGAVLVFVVGGALTTAGAAAGLLHPAVRRLE